jgi:hypothetical protein
VKKTTPSAPSPTNWTKPGNGPMKEARRADRETGGDQ